MLKGKEAFMHLALLTNTDMATIKTAMSTAFSTVQSDVSSMIATAAPYALGIIGTVLAVSIGIKVFKKLAGQA